MRYKNLKFSINEGENEDLLDSLPEEPKESKGTEEPKESKGTEEPKESKGTEEPKEQKKQISGSESKKPRGPNSQTKERFNSIIKDPINNLISKYEKELLTALEPYLNQLNINTDTNNLTLNSPNNNNKLYWFKNGLGGFFKKLWYGNEENPYYLKSLQNSKNENYNFLSLKSKILFEDMFNQTFSIILKENDTPENNQILSAIKALIQQKFIDLNQEITIEIQKLYTNGYRLSKPKKLATSN